MLTTLLYSLLALDSTLAELAAQHSWVLFVALFLVIFAETGLVVFPLLPGDSLLFLAGTVAAASGIDVHLLAIVLFSAAVAGDSVNYAVGHFLGPKVFNLPPDSRASRRYGTLMRLKPIHPNSPFMNRWRSRSSRSAASARGESRRKSPVSVGTGVFDNRCITR
jgi:hypothetical protein